MQPQPVIIRGHWYSMYYAGPMLGGFAITLFFFLKFFKQQRNDFPWDLVLVLLSAYHIFVGTWYLLVLRKRVKLLDLGEDGFLLKDRRGEAIYRDKQILALSYTRNRYIFNGEDRGYIHVGEILLGTDDGLARVPFHVTVEFSKPDDLNAFLERNLNRLMTDASSKLEAGETLPGVGWNLSPQGIVLPAKGDEEADTLLKFSQIAAISNIDGKYLIYEHGRERPSLEVPTDALNAGPLAVIISTKVIENRAASERPANVLETFGGHESSAEIGTLGRYLGQHKYRNNIVFIVSVVVQLILIFVGNACAAAGIRNGSVIDIVGGVVFILGGLGWFFYAFTRSNNTLSIFEKGVRLQRGKHISECRYDEIESLQWVVVAHYYNHAFTGNSYDIRLQKADAKARPLKIRFFGSKPVPTLEVLESLCFSAMVPKFLARFDAGQIVPWADKVEFRPEGLYCPKVPTGLMKSEPRVIQYSDIRSVSSDGQYFNVYTDAQKPVASVFFKRPNAYVGNALLSTILDRQQQLSGNVEEPSS
jgi:hypothetical protein